MKTKEKYGMIWGMKRWKKPINFIMVFALCIGLVGPGRETDFHVSASTISDVQEQMKKHQQELENINSKITGLEDEQDVIEEAIEDLNAEIINTMTSIGLLEDEIATKETELAEKQVEIDDAEVQYEAALAKEEAQRESMAVNTRMMYENNDDTYLSAILSGNGIGDIINRMDYIEKSYEYSRNQLETYIEIKDQVQALWDALEQEKAELEDAKASLEEDEAELSDLKANLDVQLAQKKAESANYDAEIKKAQQEAAVAKKLIQQDQAKIKQLQAAQNAANRTYTSTNYTSTIDNANGSELGKKIAKYACQYIGNPYGAGGTSLTSGADCSGFTYRVYSDFGYSIPRTSYQQRSAGTEVSYEDAQPGDLICYDGHVALYIGGGLIVHASTAKTGIKVSNAQYRTILSVRRIV